MSTLLWSVSEGRGYTAIIQLICGTGGGGHTLLIILERSRDSDWVGDRAVDML